jgi:DnaK suppressor protein
MKTRIPADHAAPAAAVTAGPAPADVERSLDDAERARRAHLDLLPATEDDPVAAVQRSAIQQTLEAISGARRRLADGSFGSCTRCRGAISPERLALRPWSATCVDCAGR